MLLIKRILILEDNLLVLSKILEKLSVLEGDQPFDLSLTILTDYLQVENFINANPEVKFDLIIMDRDDKMNRSFHVLDIERFGVEKVIAISSVPKWNNELKDRGVTKVIEKDLSDIDAFAEKVTRTIGEVLSKMSWV